MFYIYDVSNKKALFMGSGNISHLEAAQISNPGLVLKEYITNDDKTVLQRPNDYRLVFHRDLAVFVAIKPLVIFAWANDKDYITGDGVDQATLIATITETHALDEISELQLSIGGNPATAEVVNGVATATITMVSEYAVTVDVEANRAKYRHEKATLEVSAV